MATEKVIKPFPTMPDPATYSHLTEKERMLAGYLYRPTDSVLVKERGAARKLIYQFNNQEPEDDPAPIRREILRKLFNPDCSEKKLFVESPFRVDYGYNISAGDNLVVNFNCVFLDCAKITIGNDCMIAPGVQIYTATHPVDPKYRRFSDEYRELAFPVKIGDNVWIGGQAVIGPGVTIGDNSVVGAGSVVVKDVPANVVVAGNPAKIIRYMEGADLS